MDSSINSTPEPSDRLERYWDYLMLLGRMQLSPHWQGRVDLSGVVQQTLLEAHQADESERAFDEGGRSRWLRRVFANNLTDEVRRFQTQARDVSREISLQAAVDASSMRLMLCLWRSSRL